MVTRLAGLSLIPLLALPLAAQTPLPIGSKATGTATSDAPAAFTYTPPGPGILTIVVRGSDDLTINVVDVDGQPLPGGTADNDNNGSLGLEYLALEVSRAETIRVQVTLLSEADGGGGFTISAAFLPEDGFAKPADPDRRPSLGRTLSVGTASEESINPDDGDLWDWFVIRATEAMTVTVMTRMTEGVEGDLTLSAFTNGNFEEHVAHSDQDMQGHTGNESVTVTLKAGDTLHLKVASLSESGGASPYRISVGRVP